MSLATVLNMESGCLSETDCDPGSAEYGPDELIIVCLTSNEESDSTSLIPTVLDASSADWKFCKLTKPVVNSVMMLFM